MKKKIYTSKDCKLVSTGVAISAIVIITQALPAFALPLAFPDMKNLVANYLVIDRLSLSLSGVGLLYVTINLKKLFVKIKPHNKTKKMFFFSIKLLIVSALITISIVHGLERLPSSVNIVNILENMGIQNQNLFTINTISLTLMSYLILHSSNVINAYCSLFICSTQALLTPTIFVAIKIIGQSVPPNPFTWMEANSISIIIIFFTYCLYIREYNLQNQ